MKDKLNEITGVMWGIAHLFLSISVVLIITIFVIIMIALLITMIGAI